MNGWTTEKPLPGPEGFVNLYWLSLAPDKRRAMSSLGAVVRCEVSRMHGEVICTVPKAWYMPLSDPALVGAMWRPVEAEPTDPFAPPPVQMSRCSFCAKPTDWQCPNCMIDKGMRYPLCSESTGSDCQLRHRAFHKCHLP